MKQIPALRSYLTWHIKPMAVCAWLTTLALSLAYVAYFHSALLNSDSFGVEGFTSFVLPDTFLYKSLIDEDFFLLTLTASGVKNSIGPALLWIAAFSNWYVVAVLNSLLLLALLLYVIKLCGHFQMPPASARFIVLVLGLMPVMTYYSIGALKELPTLVAMTAFYYHFIRRQTLRWILMVFVLFLFRYQIIAVLTVFLLIDRYAKNPLRVAAIVMIMVSMAYPAFKEINILSAEAAAVYREESNLGLGWGVVVEAVRSSVPVVSAAAVAIRVMQTILEPLVQASAYGLFEDSRFSVQTLAYIVSLLLMLPFWWRTLVRSYRSFFVRHPSSRDLASLYALILLFIVPVGGFSLVHHRYLFPITALVMIGGAPLRRKLFAAPNWSIRSHSAQAPSET